MSFDLVIRGDLVLPEEVLRDGYVAVTGGPHRRHRRRRPAAGPRDRRCPRPPRLSRA